MPGRSQRHMRIFQGRDAGGSVGAPGGGGSRKAPLVATKPTIAGTVAVGQTLTGTNGTFTAVAAGGSNSAITREWVVGADKRGTGATLVLATQDKGKKVVFRNYCSNKYGRRVSESNASITVP